MRPLIFFTLLIVCLISSSCGRHKIFSAFDFLPASTAEAEINGFRRSNIKSFENLPIRSRDKISSLFQNTQNDTLVQLFFADEKLTARALVFYFKDFDSSVIIDNLRKSGEVILNERGNDGNHIGAFRKGDDVYYIYKTPENIVLFNQPGVDKATRQNGPIIEQRRDQ
jgi:hypothetical protein